MAKYRKKPVVIEAFKLGTDEKPPWFTATLFIGVLEGGRQVGWCVIPTLEGEMRGEWGDYIIKGIKGELYPCKPDIFEATYEKVEE